MTDAPAADVEAALTEHLRVALIRAFGGTVFEMWLGKDGPVQYGAEEVAAAAVAALAPLLTNPEVAAVARSLIDAQVIAAPINPTGPW